MHNHNGSIMLDHHSRPLYKSQYLSCNPLKSDCKERVGFSGRKFTYVSGDGVIRTMNSVFGYGGWGSEITMERLVYCEQDAKKRWVIGYLATVRIKILENNTSPGIPMFHEDCGSGEAIDSNKIHAHDKALKCAVTDAMKRAARHFGERLGNALYIKGNSIRNAPIDNKTALDRLEKEENKIMFGDQTQLKAQLEEQQQQQQQQQAEQNGDNGVSSAEQQQGVNISNNAEQRNNSERNTLQQQQQVMTVPPITHTPPPPPPIRQQNTTTVQHQKAAPQSKPDYNPHNHRTEPAAALVTPQSKQNQRMHPELHGQQSKWQQPQRSNTNIPRNHRVVPKNPAIVPESTIATSEHPYNRMTPTTPCGNHSMPPPPPTPRRNGIVDPNSTSVSSASSSLSFENQILHHHHPHPPNPQPQVQEDTIIPLRPHPQQQRNSSKHTYQQQQPPPPRYQRLSFSSAAEEEEEGGVSSTVTVMETTTIRGHTPPPTTMTATRGHTTPPPPVDSTVPIHVLSSSSSSSNCTPVHNPLKRSTTSSSGNNSGVSMNGVGHKKQALARNPYR